MDDACVTSFRFFVCDLVGVNAELSVVNDTATDLILPIDVLYGTTLGLHGLLFALIAYALTLLGPSIRQVNWIRQSLVVFVVLLIASAVSYWARTLTGQSPDLTILILQSVVSAFLWSPLRWFYDMVAQYAEGLRAQRQ